MTTRIQVHLQNDDALDQIPSETEVTQWILAVATHLHWDSAEVTVRMVGETESQMLNESYRNKAYPTNVLSFPFELPFGVPEEEFEGQLGDLVICAPVVARESIEQDKILAHHWAHMVIHGTLHLAGYDHENDDEADAMELIEIAILCKLGISNPYDSTNQSKEQ